MYQENVVLCGASAYEQKYYFNQDFDSLPESIKQELHIMCVLYTEDIGGILTLEFDDNGSLQFKTEALDSDAMYDDIGSVLKIKQLQTEKRELIINAKRGKATRPTRRMAVPQRLQAAPEASSDCSISPTAAWSMTMLTRAMFFSCSAEKQKRTFT